ncbi:hypothetical protein [Photobacterium leiognathi]|uniref:hypothetical protein n=1 Tax=Photobacterium leiognathi TaxID=553611 RepID=UPI002738579C|nr:hypothetical protein [Photobacterium leiognathi]
MNFRDPDLVLVKKFRGGKQTFYQVHSLSSEQVSLQDIEHGGQFSFQRKQLEDHLTKGTLTATTKSKVPQTLFVKPVTKKAKPRKNIQQAKEQAEVDRRYRYVRQLLDSNVPSLSEQRLTPWIAPKAVELEDDAPPSYKTLGRWVKSFTESGWKMESLRPAHSKKGYHKSRLAPQVSDLLDQVVLEHGKAAINVNVRRAYLDFIERLDELNQQRNKIGLPELTACSYQTILTRFRG